MYLGSNSVYNKSKQTDEVGGEKNTDWTIPSLTELRFSKLSTRGQYLLFKYTNTQEYEETLQTAL